MKQQTYQQPTIGPWTVVPVNYGGLNPATVSVSIPGFENSVEFIDGFNGRGAWHTVHHAKRVVTVPRSTLTVEQNLEGGYATWSDMPLIGEYNAFASSASFGSAPFFQAGRDLAVYYDTLVPFAQRQVFVDARVKDRCQKTLQAMLPGIRPQLSLVNDLIELKDLPSLITSLNRIRAFEANFNLGRWSQPIRTFFSAGSDNFLQWKFNVAPVIRDIAAIRSGLANIDQQLARLAANQRRYLTTRRTVDISDIYDDVSSYVTNTSSQRNATITSQRIPTYSKCVANVTMDYGYVMPSLSGWQLRLQALLDAFGVNFNPAIIWNAIPWSFVVDWIAGVGSFLSQFSVSNVRPVTAIYRACFSVHIIRNVELYCSFAATHTAGGGLVSSISEEVYTRQMMMPDLRSLSLSGVSSDEFTLAAALVTSKLTRRRF